MVTAVNATDPLIDGETVLFNIEYVKVSLRVYAQDETDNEKRLIFLSAAKLLEGMPKIRVSPEQATRNATCTPTPPFLIIER